jgi:hypothetical protein
MIKHIILAFIVVSTYGTASIARTSERWEYQGSASTGEKVYLNLDSIQQEGRKNGYFFTYQIGTDRPVAFTPCDGRFQVVTANGVTFNPLMKPQSEATQKMLDRICSYQRKQKAKPAYVFAPPSNVRTSPDGDILCSVDTQKMIETYGSQGVWFYTNVCGKMGIIHSSQIKF